MQETMTVYVEINTKSNKTTIATIYRPPKSQAADDIALYEEIKSVIQNKQAVIIGDFNCPNTDWTLMNGDREGNWLIEMAEDAFLTFSPFPLATPWLRRSVSCFCSCFNFGMVVDLLEKRSWATWYPNLCSSIVIWVQNLSLFGTANLLLLHLFHTLLRRLSLCPEAS